MSRWSVLRKDFVRYRPQMRFSRWAFFCACLGNPGLQAVFWLRLIQEKVDRRRPHQAAVARLLCLNTTGADFVPGCRVGPGLMIQHPNGIVVGGRVVVGDNCTLLHQVTLGEKYADGSRPEQSPIVGNHVTIGAGAKILGATRVGDHAAVGANSVVTTDVLPGTVVAGVPARVIREGG